MKDKKYKFRVGAKVKYSLWEDVPCDKCGHVEEEVRHYEGVVEKRYKTFLLGGSMQIPDGNSYLVNGHNVSEYKLKHVKD